MKRQQEKYNVEKSKAIGLLYDMTGIMTMLHKDDYEKFMEAFNNPDVNIKVVLDEENEHKMFIENVEFMSIYKGYYELTSSVEPLPEVAKVIADTVLSSMATILKINGYDIEPSRVYKLPIFDHLADSLLNLYGQKPNFNHRVQKAEVAYAASEWMGIRTEDISTVLFTMLG